MQALSLLGPRKAITTAGVIKIGEPEIQDSAYVVRDVKVFEKVLRPRGRRCWGRRCWGRRRPPGGQRQLTGRLLGMPERRRRHHALQKDPYRQTAEDCKGLAFDQSLMSAQRKRQRINPRSKGHMNDY
eukprot:scaffold164070_cov40-Prasinocladus_malaysianus.AAC.1